MFFLDSITVNTFPKRGIKVSWYSINLLRHIKPSTKLKSRAVTVFAFNCRVQISTRKLMCICFQMKTSEKNNYSHHYRYEIFAHCFKNPCIDNNAHLVPCPKTHENLFSICSLLLHFKIHVVSVTCSPLRVQSQLLVLYHSSF